MADKTTNPKFNKQFQYRKKFLDAGLFEIRGLRQPKHRHEKIKRMVYDKYPIDLDGDKDDIFSFFPSVTD